VLAVLDGGALPLEDDAASTGGGERRKSSTSGEGKMARQSSALFEWRRWGTLASILRAREREMSKTAAECRRKGEARAHRRR
jgi:hypothetical protein